MLNYPPAFSSARRAQATALFLIVLAGLGGCAQFPSLAPLELMKSVASYETTRTFSAPTTTWPSERWWSGYGDAQLDALIEEAASLAAATGAAVRLLSLVTVDLPASVDTGVIRIASAAHADQILQTAQ